MRAVIAAVTLAVAFLVAVAEAHPPAPIDKRGEAVQGKRHAWLHVSKMPLVNGRLRLISAPCPDRPAFSGCVYTRRPRTVYVRPRALNPKSVTYHELGHAFDLLLLRRRDRSAFKRTMGIHGRGWLSGAAAPAELFAESYALCARFGMQRPPTSKLGWTRSVYGYRPTRKQHRAVCALIARAGAKRRRGAMPQPPANAPPVFEQKPPQPQSQQPQPAPLVPVLPPLVPPPGTV